MDNGTLVVNIAFSIRMIIPMVEGLRYQASNCKVMASRLKLLKQLFEDLLQSKYPLSEATVAAFTSLHLALQDAKVALASRGKESRIYSVLRSHEICAQLQRINSNIERALSDARLRSPRVSKQIQHLAEKCVRELRATTYFVDALDDEVRQEIEGILCEHRNGKKASFEKLQGIAVYMGINTKEDVSSELAALEKAWNDARAEKRKTEEEYVDQVITLFMQLAEDDFDAGQVKPEMQEVQIPPDFRCPLSLELMFDPVIVASGQTYEKAYIQHWLDQGHTRCPKTGQELAQTNLIPNYTVKELIANWCRTHDVPLPKVDAVKSTNWLTSTYYVETDAKLHVLQETGTQASENSEEIGDDDTATGDSSAAVPAAMACVPTTAPSDTLSNALDAPKDTGTAEDRSSLAVVSRLRSSGELLLDRFVQDLQSVDLETQRTAAAELKLLARNGQRDRGRIVGAGAVSHLVALLSSSDAKTQENAVTALLNLSLDDNNKVAIADAGAIDPLILVLKVGTTEAKQNAAATLFSLVRRDNKENAGRIVSCGAIPPLVDLLRDGQPAGKKDAATALYNLSLFPENRLKIVEAGAVRPLIELITEPRIGMVERAVQVLDRLSTIHEGKLTIAEAGAIPALVEVLEAGPPRAKEQAAAILLQLCGDSRRFRNMTLEAGAVPTLHHLSRTGSARGKEKAVGLLRALRERRGHGRTV